MQTATVIFLADLALTMLVSGAVVFYLRAHLRPLLGELCGTLERAQFWLALSNVSLLLVPVIFALEYKPELGPDKPLIYAMADQFKVALIGLMVTLLGLSVVLLGFIPRRQDVPTGASPR